MTETYIPTTSSQPSLPDEQAVQIIKGRVEDFQRILSLLADGWQAEDASTMQVALHGLERVVSMFAEESEIVAGALTGMRASLNSLMESLRNAHNEIEMLRIAADAAYAQGVRAGEGYLDDDDELYDYDAYDEPDEVEAVHIVPADTYISDAIKRWLYWFNSLDEDDKEEILTTLTDEQRQQLERAYLNVNGINEQG